MYDKIGLYIRSAGYKVEAEFQFHPVRKWRADYAIPEIGLLVEIEGGAYTQGRHVRGAGYQKDCEKYNAAICAGWRLLRYTTQMFRDNPEQIIRDIREVELLCKR